MILRVTLESLSGQPQKVTFKSCLSHLNCFGFVDLQLEMLIRIQGKMGYLSEAAFGLKSC